LVSEDEYMRVERVQQECKMLSRVISPLLHARIDHYINVVITI